MQPELFALLNRVSASEPSTVHDPSIQHGLPQQPAPTEPVSPRSDDTDHVALSAEEQVARDAALAASLAGLANERSNILHTSGGLSEGSAPSTPAYNRITEYEKAATPPVSKRREGPAFEVIQKTRSPGDKRSPIADLPNEILTHAVAHLSPADLASVALVSKRFHALITTPHAWRTAFARYFPGPDSLNPIEDDDSEAMQNVVKTERRVFTRLTTLASWRSEYIIRTRLLRSLARGKPVQPLASSTSARSGQAHTASPTVVYNSQLFTTINHLHVTFGRGYTKKLPRLIHGADDVGNASMSDSQTGKVDQWGLSDPQFFVQFVDRYPGDAQYGLGPGEIVGVPNVMDVSQLYGMVHGEGFPGGMCYYRAIDEMRGRFLLFSSALSQPQLGIPKISSANEAMCAIWIAKSQTIPQLSNGMVGILAGSSSGVLTSYSLGLTSNNGREQRFARGEMSARWVISPGVPLVAIAVDNEYSLKRQAQNRIWAVVLNALGEVFYLTKFPKRSDVDRGQRLDDDGMERLAWQAGRSVYWNVVEPSRRVAKPDPYSDAAVDGSYSPRSSWNGMCLSAQQVEAETREIEDFVKRKPKDFRRACVGWDMRRRLELDFANDDGNNAGETVAVVECGIDEGAMPGAKRYVRCRYYDPTTPAASTTPPSLTETSTPPSSSPSIFGGSPSPRAVPTPGFSLSSLEETLSHDDFGGSITPRPTSEEWRTSVFTLGGLKETAILTSCMDNSLLSLQTLSEDLLLSFSGQSANSSPSMTPLSFNEPTVNSADIPGQRARFVAVGTNTGSVIVWNMRAPVSRSAEIVNTIDPIRIIRTDSPQISCLALSSLYLVHGGNDGLVQTWDVLASTMAPIRTLHSRFSSRARRRLVQAQASPQGVGINLFAAGAICLDPDPTVLRGVVSLGTQLLYWSYSSSAADQYKSNKRRFRRSERGSNNGGERFSGATRGNLKDYIANEKFELEREKESRNKDQQRIAGRFGTELLGDDASEEELIAYAAILSQESHELEKLRKYSDPSTEASAAVSSSADSVDSSHTPTPSASVSASPAPSRLKTEDEYDADIAEAIRQSLASSPSQNSYEIPIRQAKAKNRKATSPGKQPRTPTPPTATSSMAGEMDDLEFAMQLSLAEEQSRKDAEGDEFPTLSPDGAMGKGKGRMKR